MGADECGLVHEFALNAFGTSRIRVDCSCMAMIAFDTRDSTGGLYLGSGFDVIEGAEALARVADADVVQHAGPWPKAEFLDDPWEELWNKPTTERSHRESRRLNGPTRVMASAVEGKSYTPRRADQLPVMPNARYIIAEDCGPDWWYGMQVDGDFGFILKSHVLLDDEDNDAVQSSDSPAAASDV